MKKFALIFLLASFVVGCSGSAPTETNVVEPTDLPPTAEPTPTEAEVEVADVIEEPTPTEEIVVIDPTEPPAPSVTKESVSGFTACNAFLDNTTTRCESDTAFVESDGLPTTHNMMVGIISWQQQVALPQPYTGNNAWQIPLNPELADEPISARNDLFRGAIALAINGVPIFNALNNRGVDAYLAGELDEWGGHSGRGDDYHYHTAPVHLQEFTGIDHPIAYALDGFPIYGLVEPDGSAVVDLDEFNGHFDEDGAYHYHATETYPYINGGMRGEVGYGNGQIEPQPRAQAVRPAGDPLRGAEITEFVQTDPNAYSLLYTLNGETYTVNYAIENGVYTFEFIDPNGNQRIETYTP